MPKFSSENPLVYTVKNLCKVCYTCVRECPVKAIKIDNGQAEVIQERCIACGNCIQVCSQGAKVFFNSTDNVFDIIKSEEKTIACIAPSFPAEFNEIDNYKQLVGMMREIGFDYVTEVSFGADLVAREYKHIFDNNKSTPIITSDCPAIVYYIEHYHPEIANSLAPILSPAMAMAKVVRKKYGANTKVIFIGPCVAKKAESDYFDEVITFTELKQMFVSQNINHANVKESQFDGPHSGKGAIFPVNHGLLKSINKTEGFEAGQVITAEGKKKFKEAVKEFKQGALKTQHLELLSCDGCIQGPGMTDKGNLYAKRKNIFMYVKSKLETLDEETWQKDMQFFSDIDLSRNFEIIDRRLIKPDEKQIAALLIKMGKTSPNDLLNCGTCGYDTCNEHAIAVLQGLAEQEMCLPFTIEELHKSIKDLSVSNKILADTRQALKQSEKLASMGQVSAGIAHELNNPLGIITLYSSALKDDLDVKSEVYQDIKIIDEQAERCKNIVGGLLNFARKNKVQLSDSNITKLIEHSFDSILKPKNITINFINNIENNIVKLDYDQMMQVITNLEKNAIEAMPNGGRLLVELSETIKNVEIKISDNGTGISQENLEKIFTPFFTTKIVGKGTGLGLSLVYGIIKMHKAKINVKSNDKPEKGETGTTFLITIPKDL